MALKKPNNNYPQFDTELRQDLVTKEWIAIAPKRQKRSEKDYKAKAPRKLNKYKKKCPFEDPQASGNAPPVLLYGDENTKDLSSSAQVVADWSLQIIPNKYPIFDHGGRCGVEIEHGPYKIREGSGRHEVIITRDHDKHLALLENSKVLQVVTAYRERFLQLKDDDCIKYVSIFHNHGPSAGATIYHPHSQLAAMPVIPTDIHRSLANSHIYYERNKKCVHCIVVDWETKEKERVLVENDDFIVFCPYASRVNFEIEIFPKKHGGHFEKTNNKELVNFADALHKALNFLYKSLDNPDYNFFIHTAPTDGNDYPNYHWHVEIFPKTETWAGIELGTGMEILTISPEDAVRYLKKP